MGDKWFMSLVILFCLIITSGAWAQKSLPKKMAVPYGPPHQENVTPSHVYHEPGTELTLRLVITTPHKNDTLDGSLTYKLWYQISHDGGNTYGLVRQLIVKGDQFDAYHPVPGIDVRKVGFVASHAKPFRASNGEIIVPIELWRMDENGERYLPPPAWSYCDSALLIGRWTDYSDIEWEMSERVQLPLTKSTSGAYEPAAIELTEPGHMLMVLRSSNFGDTSIPSYRWKSISRDYGRTWSEPTVLTYENGAKFFSPASCSELIRHSSGRLFWVGNIISHNANGNHPRYPLVIAEINEASCSLIKDSVQVVLTRDPEVDSPRVEYSNARVREDPLTGHFVINAPYRDKGKFTGEWREAEVKVGASESD